MDFQGFVQKIDVAGVFTHKQSHAGGDLLNEGEQYQVNQQEQDAHHQNVYQGGVNLPRNVKRDYSQPVQVQAGFNIPPPAQPTSPTGNSLFVQQTPAYPQSPSAYAQPQQQFQPFASPTIQPQQQFQPFTQPQQQFTSQPTSQFTFQQAQAQQNFAAKQQGGIDDMLDFNAVQTHAPQQQHQRASPIPKEFADMDGLVDLDNIEKTSKKQYGKASHITRPGF